MKRFYSEPDRAGGGETGCAALIMAAGKGTRMKSDLPKVLHELGGKEMVRWVIEAARAARLGPIILILGHQAALVRARLEEGDGSDLRFVVQEPQNGTGHAVQMARDELAALAGDVVVLSGDVPLIRPETIRSLLDTQREERAAATVLTTVPDDPTGYGRIVRDVDGSLLAIREQRDASEDELAIGETNTGIYCFSIDPLLAALEQLRPDNDQGEYYLTDAPLIIRRNGHRIVTRRCADPVETEGINDRAQLAAMERLLAERKP